MISGCSLPTAVTGTIPTHSEAVANAICFCIFIFITNKLLPLLSGVSKMARGASN
jgi:hypothetical protein